MRNQSLFFEDIYLKNFSFFPLCLPINKLRVIKTTPQKKIRTTARQNNSVFSTLEEISNNKNKGKGQGVNNFTKNNTFATKIGRPKKDVPEDFILQLSRKGKTLREIAIIIHAEKGILVHYSTIQRILAGQKLLI